MTLSTEEYEHHGMMVTTLSKTKGQHRDYCLCYQCDKFRPGRSDNCLIAQTLFQTCIQFHVTTPVFECPEFETLEKTT